MSVNILFSCIRYRTGCCKGRITSCIIRKLAGSFINKIILAVNINNRLTEAVYRISFFRKKLNLNIIDTRIIYLTVVINILGWLIKNPSAALLNIIAFIGIVCIIVFIKPYIMTDITLIRRSCKINTCIGRFRYNLITCLSSKAVPRVKILNLDFKIGICFIN